MKARRNPDFAARCTVAGALLLLYLPLQSQAFSKGKSLHELQLALRDQKPTVMTNRQAPIKPLLINRLAPSIRPLAAERLPFFCKIEHQIAKKSKVSFKFRLGSVDYVDWLEGKGDFPVFVPR